MHKTRKKPLNCSKEFRNFEGHSADAAKRREAIRSAGNERMEND
ncbi:MAG: hypothetical protein ACQETG_02680 [Thermodesulfobacteriota bacterium]